MNALQIIPLEHMGEITKGTPLSRTIKKALQKQSITLEDNDILVITQKIVSKAEGRTVNLRDIEPSYFAKTIAKQNKKNPAHIEMILRESKRIVRMDHGVIITETHHGFICANAGVDESNVGNNKIVTLLPKDPDGSAKRISDDLTALFTIKNIGIIISDTWGRPWREGQVNFAIGVHGISPLIDYRGQKDSYGYVLKASVIAIADEIAAAAELVFGKTNKIPAALIRGYTIDQKEGNGKMLIRNSATDMFR